jgi:choline dehydrogenase-like flavoprotein
MGAAGNTHLYDWNFTTIPQPSLNNREIPFARGHIVGGSSSVSKLLLMPLKGSMALILIFVIDCMIYTRGSADDYDKMAEISGEEAWTWENLVPYMKRVCCYPVS